MLHMELTRCLFTCSLLLFFVSISIERLHATRNPVRHRSMTALSYKIWISCIWVPRVIYASVVALLLFYDTLGLHIWFFQASCVFVSLLTLSLSYCGIFVTDRCSKQLQHSHRGQARKERRLTMRLFIVMLVSLSVWIPYVQFTFLESHVSRRFSPEVIFHARGACEALIFANSFFNPVLYAIRLPQFKKASINLRTLFCQTTKAS